MYEIPFVSKDILNQADDKRAMLQTARMQEVITFADKLTEAGWPIEWTITGLAFYLPSAIKYGAESERTPAAIRQKLAGMGIPDEFRICSSRSLVEVVTAKREYVDREQYALCDKRIHDTVGDEFINWEDHRYISELLQAMVEIEDLYDRKELIAKDDYERGTVTGRRQALDWVFGEDWPDLQPEDEFEAEYAEEERAYVRREQAIDEIHELLFGKPDTSVLNPEPRSLQEPAIADTPPVPAPPTDDDKKRFVAEIFAGHLNGPTPSKLQDVQPSAN